MGEEREDKQKGVEIEKMNSPGGYINRMELKSVEYVNCVWNRCRQCISCGCAGN